MKKFSFFLFSFFYFFTAILINASDNSPFVRYPALNNDGSKIAFSYQGDIWVVPVEGGQAVRITIHEGYDATPKWNADGSKIAFSSNRYGNNDIYTISSNGGNPKRLTYHSTGDALSDWANDGTLLFSTNRVFRQVEWDSEIYTVSSNGGTPYRLLNSVGNMPSKSPDGKLIALVRGSCRITRENYQGPANKDIWIYNTENDKYTKITNYDGNDIYPRWGDSGTLYFISSRSGKYNVFRIKISGSGNLQGTPEQITNFDDDGVRYFDVSNDGSTLVMERQTNFYSMKANDDSPKKVDIQIGADYRLDPLEHKTFSSDAGEYAVSPNGKYSAIVIKGEIFISENDKDKKRTVNLSEHAYRDLNLTWLSDTTLIFVSDRYGQYDLFLVKSSDKEQPNLLKSLKHEIVRLTDTEEDESYPIISPDGKQLAFERGRGTLIVMDIDAEGNLSKEKTLLNGWDPPGNVTWSPDSKWLAYSLSDLNFNSEVYIHPADNSAEPVNISMHPRGDYYPVWSVDGSKLGFVSNRNNGDNDIWFVWLNKEDWEKTKQDWDEDDDEDKNDKKKKEDNDTTKTVEPIKIDFEDIHERLAQVTSLPGDEGSLAISKNGETFYYTTKSNTAKGRDLYQVKWDGTDVEAITKGGKDPSATYIDKDGKYLYMLSKGKLSRIDLKSKTSESLPFSAKMTVDHKKQKEQIFEEAWRILRDGFYDPDYHGQDWFELREKYKPWALKASTPNDFRDMFNIMLGKLNASHMGLYRTPDRLKTQKENTGLLGIEVKHAGDGVTVTHVVPNSPADRLNSKLAEGDVILSVKGDAVTSEINFYSLLTNTRESKVIFEVKNKAGETREVIIQPTNRLGSLLYNEWVKARRKLVDKYSNGRLGYLHIQAMGWTSFERFERELTAAGLGKEGIVIDVRFNGGGWTTDYLMTVLNVRQHAYTIPRGAADDLKKEHKKFKEYYPYGERLPFAAWVKSSIAICNANSYSNAEIFSHAYKTLGLGTLVGMPTFGAVISTGGKGLLDGSYVRLPFRGWYVKATEENMELGPAVPDIILDNAPDSKAKGNDEQLKRAVDELLNQIDSK